MAPETSPRLASAYSNFPPASATRNDPASVPSFETVSPALLHDLLPAVLLHLGFLFAALGLALGRGFLRLSIPDMLRRSARPVALAVFALVVGAVALPLILPDLEPDRTFRRFLLPLACVFAAFPLLSIRDLRAKPCRPGAPSARSESDDPGWFRPAGSPPRSA